MGDFDINVYSDKLCLSGQPYMFAFKLTAVDSVHNSDDINQDPFCIWGIPHNITLKESQGWVETLQINFTKAIQGKLITVWHPDDPQKYKDRPIPGKPKRKT
ncbi:hypothetical protein ACQY0O_006995 [Thecaphora frezii]